MNASAECQRLCHELSLYTLSHGDAFFIHQVAVDAYAAQHAGPASKPITVAFALIGLCLLLERGHTGRAVQRARPSNTWWLCRAPFRRRIAGVCPLHGPPRVTTFEEEAERIRANATVIGFEAGPACWAA